MKRGFIIPILFLITLGATGYYLFTKYSESPNQITRNNAQKIYKYPNSDNWEVKPHHNVCLIPKSQCVQPIDIVFSSNDTWPTVYNFYKTYLTQNDWSTNSTIYTSVPTSIVFETQQCQMNLESKRSSFLNDNKISGPPYQYTFSLICQ